MGRLTIDTPTGAALKLDNPKNDSEARQQLAKKYILAINLLAEFEKRKLTPEGIDALKAENEKLKAEKAMTINELRHIPLENKGVERVRKELLERVEDGE